MKWNKELHYNIKSPIHNAAKLLNVVIKDNIYVIIFQVIYPDYI